jgi:hypothetical protein
MSPLISDLHFLSGTGVSLLWIVWIPSVFSGSPAYHVYRPYRHRIVWIVWIPSVSSGSPTYRVYRPYRRRIVWIPAVSWIDGIRFSPLGLTPPRGKKWDSGSAYSALTPLVLRFPSWSVRAGFDRKVQEIDGAWKQYSRSEKFRIFPVGNGQKSPKEPKIFRPGILLPIPIDFCGFSAGNDDFSWSFRPVSIVLGDRNPRPGLYSAILHSYSACTPLYSTRTPLVLHSYSALLRSYSASTPLVLRCTPLVLRFYSTRTPEYWSLAFSPLVTIEDLGCSSVSVTLRINRLCYAYKPWFHVIHFYFPFITKIR